jgi:hypothetical protein
VIRFFYRITGRSRDVKYKEVFGEGLRLGCPFG